MLLKISFLQKMYDKITYFCPLADKLIHILFQKADAMENEKIKSELEINTENKSESHHTTLTNEPQSNIEQQNDSFNRNSTINDESINQVTNTSNKDESFNQNTDTLKDLSNPDESINQETNQNPNQESQEKEESLKEKDELIKKIQMLEQQLAEMNDKYIRLLAEFDNFRKRTRKEKEDLIKYAGEEVWKSILPILDDFDRAIKENANANDIEVVKKGFEIIHNKLKHLISQYNIVPIDTLHKEFNADIMEAVAKVPAQSEELKGKVVEELEKAYQMHDKIIRHAKVIVGE